MLFVFFLTSLTQQQVQISASFVPEWSPGRWFLWKFLFPDLVRFNRAQRPTVSLNPTTSPTAPTITTTPTTSSITLFILRPLFPRLPLLTPSHNSQLTTNEHWFTAKDHAVPPSNISSSFSFHLYVNDQLLFDASSCPLVDTGVSPVLRGLCLGYG